MSTPNRTITIPTGHQVITIYIEREFDMGAPYGRVVVEPEPTAPESFCGSADWYYKSAPVGHIALDEGHGFTSTQAHMIGTIIYNLIGLHRIDF